MASTSLDLTLDKLDELKLRFSQQDNLGLERILSQLARRRFPDAASLIRFHELLLFCRAYPHSPALLKKTEELLASFYKRVEQLSESNAADLFAFTRPEVSGIAGTSFSAIWGYDVVRDLAARHPSQVEIDWDGYEGESLLVAVLKKLLPLFEDGAYAEYPVPYLRWLRAAKSGNGRDLAWILRRFENLPSSDFWAAELFDSLKLWVHWEFGNSRATRTNMRRRVNNIFYHDGPLITRREVSLARELEESLPLPLRELSPDDGRRLLDLGRDTMAVRYRELHGFTYGDSQRVVRADAGRGVEFFIWGVPPDRRFPILGYHAVLILKNGVPVGYAESLSFFERSEVGLNLFYTFRDGESAWIYARLLVLLRQFLGVEVLSVEPYQLGSHNEEGINSGAFWFYRKLGFRSVQTSLAAMALREEQRVAAREGYRTPARILRRLAGGHMIYELPSVKQPGIWDRFHIGNIGLAVERRMVADFDGDEEKLRRASVLQVSRALGIDTANWNVSERRAFSKLALVFALFPDLSDWSKGERKALVGIVRAKGGRQESHYVRLLQNHSRLRDEILKIGSRDVR